MKNTFKKVAAIALAVLMCVGAMVPTFAAGNACPGTGKIHTAVNCTYVEVSKQEATCETAGFVTGKCTTCSAIFNVSQTEALGHDWDATVAATCYTAGTRTCKVCDKVDTVSPALDHLYTAWTVTGGVCKVGERITRTCVYCGDEQKETLKDEGHKFALVSYIAPANCVTNGQANYECVVDGCDATKTVVIEAGTAGHSYAAWTDAKGKDPNAVPATCASTGRKSVVCSLCGDVKVEAVAKTSHTLVETAVAAVPATCTTTGLASYKYCLDCRAYFNAAGTAQVKYEDLVIKANHDTSATTCTLTTSTEVLPTCTTDGWKYVSCSVEGCTYKNVKIDLPKYESHVYYADVKDNDQKIQILVALGVEGVTSTSKYDSTVAAKWNALGVVKADGSGKDKVWFNYISATCTTDALVTWRCLNCMKNKDGNYVFVTCAVATPVTPAGDAYVKTGHVFADTKKVATFTGTCYTDTPAATCEGTGVRVYNCQNGCSVKENKPLAALGHKWVEATQIANPAYDATKADDAEYNVPEKLISSAVNCMTNGVQYYTCANNGCGKTKTEDIVSTGTEHNYVLVSDSTKTVTAYAATLACGESKTVTVYCSVPGCPAGANPTSYTIAARDHVYVDVTAQATINALKTLAVNGTYTDANGATITYLTEGNCEQGATYKLTCANCSMFKSYEIKDGYAQGHVKTYIANSAVAATCTANGHSNRWYCANKGCEYYFDDSTGAAPSKTFAGSKNNGKNFDTVYAAKHTVWDATTKTGKTVDYKMVPDTKVSGAANATAAAAVEAPVDANGNVTRYVAIEGTSLVWVYKYTSTDHTETQVANGGLYCVDCKTGVTLVRAAHIYSSVTNKTATCENYGYSEQHCTLCFLTKQSNYTPVASHSYLFITGNDGKITTEAAMATAFAALSAEQKETRAFRASTCTAAGYAIDVCTVCNKIETVSIKADGHSNANGELTASCLDTNTNRMCSVCNVTVNKAHDYNDAGVCKECGETK